MATADCFAPPVDQAAVSSRSATAALREPNDHSRVDLARTCRQIQRLTGPEVVIVLGTSLIDPFDVTTTGVTGVAAHIHTGARGQNGPISVGMVKTSENDRSIACCSLPIEVVADAPNATITDCSTPE